MKYYTKNLYLFSIYCIFINMGTKRKIRKVTCKICNNDYAITGIATHFKDTHKLTPDEYVSQHEEYRPKQLDYNNRAKANQIECKVCNDMFGSERLLSYHIRQFHSLSKKEYVLHYILNGVLPKCKCGCNQHIKLLGQPPYYREYVSGHNPNGMIGNQHSEESKKQMSDKAILRMGNSNKQDTQPEKEFEQLLIKWNIEYIKQYPHDLGSIDFYLIETDMLVEIDGEYWHPTTYENLNFQLLSSGIGDKRKSEILNLIRIRSNDIRNLNSLQDLTTYNYTYNFNIDYRQKILTKEYLTTHTNKSKYTWLLLKFLRKFQDSFPYPTTNETLDLISTTIPTKISNIYNPNTKTFNNNKTSNIGNQFIKSKFKSFWKSKYKDNYSPIEIWNDDTKLKQVIENRIGITHNEVFDFSLHTMIRGMSARRNLVSFFKPTMAASIYNQFLGDVKSPTVFDPCCGFGARLIGFKSMYPNGTYIGVEPNIETYNELSELSKNFTNVKLYNCKLEDFNENINPDLTFTSIPYYDLETYSNPVLYNSIEEWQSTFISKLLTYPNLCINIPNNLRNLFPPEMQEYFLRNNTSHTDQTKTTKTEYILRS